MRLLNYVGIVLLFSFPVAQATDSISFSSETGDTLMLHHLINGEIWGSLIITDQVADNFANYELIVLQVDQHQPIKLDHEKRCNTPAGEAQKVDYTFKAKKGEQVWQFSQVKAQKNKTDFLKLTGWDKAIYQHMKSDRRPNVVDFPIKAALALDSLWPQFQQGEHVVFHYTTDADESREASFNLISQREKIKKLIDK